MEDKTTIRKSLVVRGALRAALFLHLLLTGCAQPRQDQTSTPTTQSSAEAPQYDTSAAKPIVPRDKLERLALDRGADLRMVDKMMDAKTQPPPFERQPPSSMPAGTKLGPDLAPLDDRNPFPQAQPLPRKDVTIRVGLARSTYRTREREEVLSAAQPFIDLEQREVNVRGEPALHEKADEAYFAMLDGKDQMLISHIFDYLLIRSWFESTPDTRAILLGYAEPAHPRSTPLDRDLPGPIGTSVELVVAENSQFKQPGDLKNARLALAANATHGPGAFLTSMLTDLKHPLDKPFFGSVTLRRYQKDAVIDVMKGKADVACVDQGTISALDRFYGLSGRIRTLAVSPRYNIDVLFTSSNNLEGFRTEIELTQRQLNTLAKDPEGQEVLFFFDEAGWKNFEEGDLPAAFAHFPDFVKFIEQTPVDLKPLLDPNAPVDRRTYDRLGDEG